MKQTRVFGSIFAASLLGLVAAGTLAFAAPTDVPAVKKNFGFLFADMYGMAYNNGPGDCPDGQSLSPLDLYVASVTPAERERISHLTKAELKNQVFSKIPGYGDGVDFELDNGYAASHDACTTPQDYLDTPTGEKLFKGPISYGINLDGGDGRKVMPNTCAHEKFAGPNGEKGIDNQLFRIQGCAAGRRSPLTTAEEAKLPKPKGPKRVNGGVFVNAYLLEITATNLQNDNDVTVGIYTSLDPTPVDAEANILPDASMHILNDPKFINITHGKIVNGVLTTEPMDLRILPRQIYTSMSEKLWHDAHLRITFTPDGMAEGMMAGYEDVDLFYKHVYELGGFNNEINTGYTCVGIYKAVHAMADGYPDPKTGKCTAISSAYAIAAVPAFVIHPKDGETMSQVAQADTSSKPGMVGRLLKSMGW